MEVSMSSQGRPNVNTAATQNEQVKEVKPEIKKVESVGEKKISEGEVKKAVEKLNVLFQDNATHVEYEVYGKQHTITTRIIDDKTSQVVKELPPKKIIDMVDKLCEMAGILVDEKA